MSDIGNTTVTKIGTVLALWRYPVSSLAGESLEQVSLTTTGVVGDQLFGVFDAETDAIIYPSKDPRWNGAPLVFARLKSQLELELSADGNSWSAADTPEMLAQIGTVLGRSIRLLQYGSPTSNGVAAPRYKQSPIHLLSVQAMSSLRDLMPASVIEERRFRPNILVDMPEGQEAIPEYELLGKEFYIGGLRLRGTDPCARCGFTTLAQEGLPEDPQVLRTLVKQFERNFGIYCEVLDQGEVAVGDPLSLAGGESKPDMVVVIGAGQAGAMAARALRRHGFSGRIQIVGEERHLPYERPPLSKSIFSSHTGHQARVPVLRSSELKELGIDVLLNAQAVEIRRSARQVELADGSNVGYTTLIVATGGQPRRIPGIDRGHARVHVLRTLDDAELLGRAVSPGATVFVTGGGWIGMEMAAAARTAGCQVTFFARGDRLAPRILPPAIGDYLAALHRANGVNLVFGAEPRFEETEDAVLSHLNGEVSRADALVVAIGMIANDGLARRSGLECENGIVTDADGATSDPHVFAIGDVALQPQGPQGARMRVESWQNANDHADRAARAIMMIDQPAERPLRFWSDQFGRRLQIVGLPKPTAPVTTFETLGDGLFWDFGTFAVGIDCPERMNHYAKALAVSDATHGARNETEKPEPIDYSCLTKQLVMPTSNLRDGELKKVVVTAVGQLAVTRQSGQVYAFDDGCPHATASLAEGFVDAGRIVCPLHFAEFDLKTGTPYDAPPGCPHLTCYPVQEEGGEIFVWMKVE